MKNNNQRIEMEKKLLEIFNELSPRYQQAFIFIIENHHCLKNMLRNENFTEIELNEYINNASENNEVLLHALLLFKITLDKH